MQEIDDSPLEKEGVTVVIRITSSSFYNERFEISMERVAKRHLMAHVSNPQSTLINRWRRII